MDFIETHMYLLKHDLHDIVHILGTDEFFWVFLALLSRPTESININKTCKINNIEKLTENI